MDSQGYPSQPSYVYVMRLLLTCWQRVLVCSLCRKKFGQSFRWRRWAERTGACSSGNNASLPILGLCYALQPEWKQGIKWLSAYFWQQGPNCWGDWVSEMIHCYWLAHQQQYKSKEKERETLSDIWVSHHRQCSHLYGAEGVGSKNQPWANSTWPPQWLTWEWQDYAILQANPFSNHLSQHHIWWKIWFG